MGKNNEKSQNPLLSRPPVLLAFVAIRLWPLFKLLILSTLLAVPLYRLVRWVTTKGWPRWSGVLLATLALLLAVAGLVALVGPMALSQASNLGKNLPKLKEELLHRVPPGFRSTVEHASDLASNTALQTASRKAFETVKATLGGVLDLVLVLALTIYLIVDGPRALEWLIAFFPRKRQGRVSKGLDKIGDRVVAYIVGQLFVSSLFAGYAMVLLSILHVPMALLLALSAGVLDVVPVLGISISLSLATLMALTVSSTTAMVTLAFYGAYHVLENYFIIPKIYGRQLRLSTLAVLVSMLAGGLAAGLLGAVAILPLVAAYPALESLWLSRELEPAVVQAHQEQLRAA